MKILRIATRQSALALWQANHIKHLLESSHQSLRCEIIGMTTQGDRDKTSPLSQMGGKGVFVKELETALLDGSVDIAVHSMKDVPGELPGGLHIAAVARRASPKDALVSNSYQSLADLPLLARVGSSSLRRVLQVQKAYPNLRFMELRGNVDTRLRKLDEDEYDAIILAVAGLSRLGLENRITEEIATDVCVPAAGQGAVGVECRSDDADTMDLLAVINDQASAICVTAERRVTQLLGATCNLPIAVFAEISGGQISIISFVSDTTGTEVIRETSSGPVPSSIALAEELGQKLLAKGAAKMIKEDSH